MNTAVTNTATLGASGSTDNGSCVHGKRDTAADVLGFRQRNMRAATWLAFFVILLGCVMALGVIVGPVPISLGDTAAVVAHHVWGAALPETAATVDAIIWDIRIPRVLLGLAVGAGLAVAGVVLQAVVRNVLADPYILGINSGASTGAAAAILFGAGAGMGTYALQGSAFIGALLGSALMFFVARSAGRLTSIRLLMSGVAVGYALSALTSFMIFASDSAEGSRSVMFWLLGSLGLAKWDAGLFIVLVVVLAGLIFFMAGARSIDALTVGDDTAITLGINPERLRIVLVVAVCVVVGCVVALAGSIGFVGLIVPHVARRVVGGTHRWLLPTAAVLGAILIIAADVAARTLFAPQELSIGIITALIGTPWLLMLVRKMNTKG